VKFEFDPAKSASNKAKHGLDFTEAQALWKDGRVRVPAKTVEGEARYALIGKIKGRHHTVIVTYRGMSIRIVSARPSSKNEIQIHEQNKTS
jgi:uncharacterized DUF497 family protein